MLLWDVGRYCNILIFVGSLLVWAPVGVGAFRTSNIPIHITICGGFCDSSSHNAMFSMGDDCLSL